MCCVLLFTANQQSRLFDVTDSVNSYAYLEINYQKPHHSLYMYFKVLGNSQLIWVVHFTRRAVERL